MLKEWKQLKCSVCGGELEEKNDKLVCRYCRTTYEGIERISEDEVIQLNQATVQRTRLLFDDAQDRYDLILKNYPNNSEAAWGAFLCSYGIIYEQDYDGSYKPTCHRLNECPVEKSPYFAKLSSAAKQKAREIESLRQKILSQANSIPPYDVFICYKATDDWYGRNMPTKESSWARDIYELLTRDMGLKVFFAEKCLSGSNTDYEPHIYSALQSAKLMLVLANSLEHVNAVWVQNEWRRYAKYVREGANKTIRVVFDGIEPYALPKELQTKQAICHDSMDWGKQIQKSVEEIFRKEEPKKDKRDEELELLRKQIEELKNAQKQQAAQSAQAVQAVPATSESLSMDELMKKGEFHDQKKEYKKALPYYQKAAELGNANAQFAIGYYYEYAQGVAKDCNKAIYWYEKAAQQNEIRSQFFLGQIYDNGLDVAKDYVKAFYWFEKAALQGHKDAQFAIGYYYQYAQGVAKDCNKAIYWYEKAAQQNEIRSQFFLGQIYDNGLDVAKDYVKAFYWFEKAALQGHKEAQFAIGYYYEYAQGVSTDYSKAIYWYEKSATQGEVRSQFFLAQMYDYGLGGAKDYTKAFYWYEKAATQGHKDAQFSLAYFYEHAQGVAKDYTKAIYWYEKAAAQGHKESQGALGYLYDCGFGVKQDHEKAFYWYKKSAEQNYSYGQYMTGRCYEIANGVKKDLSQAIYWYEKAAAQGYEAAKTSLNFLKK